MGALGSGVNRIGTDRIGTDRIGTESPLRERPARRLAQTAPGPFQSRGGNLRTTQSSFLRKQESRVRCQ